MIQSQPGPTVPQDPISKNPSQKNRASGVAQGESSEFKLQYHKKKKKENLRVKSKEMSSSSSSITSVHLSNNLSPEN
jgi:hypothetical protein